jgi:hypothetical protein
MSQNDFNIANQGFPSFRSDLNSALQALASTSSGATAPATPYANQLWYDTANDLLKIRNEANSAWITLFGVSTDGFVIEEKIIHSGDTNTSIRFPIADTVTVETDGAERLRVNSSGTVLVGKNNANNTTAGHRLDASGFVSHVRDGNSIALFNRLTSDGEIVRFERDGSAVGSIGAASSGLTFGAGGTTERMRIDSTGNVGIGTANPASIVGGTDTSPVLSIGGTDGTLTNDDKAGSLSFITNDSAYTVSYADGVTGEIASISETLTGGGYGLSFYTGVAGGTRGERMRINRLGNVGIGTTSPAEQLHITGNLRVGSAVLATPTGSAPMYTARAWVSCLGASPANIEASGNVSSVTYNAAGDYTVNLTTAMPDDDYSFSVTPFTSGSGLNSYGFTTKTTTALRVRTITTNTGSLTAPTSLSVAIFR